MKKIIAPMIAVLLFTGCAKDGDTGPMGPTGSTGTDGTNGETAVTTFTVDIQAADWLESGTVGSLYYHRYFEKSYAEITQSVVNYGNVVVYAQESNYWNVMPWLYYYPGGGYNFYFESSFSLNTVKVAYSRTDLQDPGTPIRRFKILIIDGTARLRNPGLDWSKYEEVARALQLKD